MNPYWFLTAVFAMCCVGSWASYTKFKENSWYVIVMGLLGAGCAVLFGMAARRLDSNAKVYVFSLTYDSLMAFCYYLLPLIFFSTKLNAGTATGVILVLVGLVVVHAFGS